MHYGTDTIVSILTKIIAPKRVAVAQSIFLGHKAPYPKFTTTYKL